MQEENKKERLSYEAFCRTLQEQVKVCLGEDCQVEHRMTQKNNGVWKEMLLVREESKEAAPSFYLEEMYRSYCMGHPMEALAEYIGEILRNGTLGEIKDMEQVLSKEWFEERLFLRLVHFGKNEQQLEDAVYVRVLDLAAVFYVLTEASEEGIKSFRLPKSAWEQAELGTPEEYFDTILQNTERLFPARLMCIEEGLLQCKEQEGEEISEWLMQELEDIKQGKRPTLFYVLTNTAKVNGAATLLYKGMQERLEEQFGKGFYILPSSVHEVLLLPETREADTELNRMVREVNETQVLPEEVLSDHVYYYEKEIGLCSQVTEEV